jgi:hypothetical protein
MQCETHITLELTNSNDFYFSLSRPIYTNTKNERESLQDFLFNNSQQLILSHIYASLCLIFSTKDLITQQELISLTFSYLKPLFNTTEMILSS